MAQLTPNNIVTSEVSGFLKTGQTYRAKRVTFFVGNLGPFTKEFAVGTDTNTITAYIDQVAAEENALQQRYSG